MEKTDWAWDALLTSAMLGTRNATLSPTLQAEWSALGMATEDMTDTQILLEAAAFYAQFQKLSRPLATWTADLPVPADAVSASPPTYLSDDLMAVFQTILRLHQLCLREFSLMAQAASLYLPHHLLPIALTHAAEFPATWNFIAPMLDDRAWWLIPKRGVWASLADKPFDAKAPAPLEAQTALSYIEKIKDLLQAQSSFVSDQDWKNFKEAAYFLAVESIAYWLDFWTQHPRSFDFRNRVLHQFTGILDFRLRFLKEFHVLEY